MLILYKLNKYYLRKKRMQQMKTIGLAILFYFFQALHNTVTSENELTYAYAYT